MGQETIKERVLGLVRRSSRPLDDDEIARALGVSPRQSINQACNKLVHERLLRRVNGPDGKIVNEPTELAADDDTRERRPGDVESVRLPLPPGDSREQQQAETVMTRTLGEQLGVVLRPRRLLMPHGGYVEIDGADQDLSVLVEAWAHQGPPKAAQKHKVRADALKLHWVASTLPSRPRLILCLSDAAAATPFTSAQSWTTHALAALEIEVRVVHLPDDVCQAVVDAQRRQRR